MVDTNYFLTGAILNNRMYWMSVDYGELCFIDLENKKCGKIKDLTSYERKVYSSVLCSNTKYIYGVQDAGKYFWKYDVIDNHFDSIMINCEKYGINLACSAKVFNNDLVVITRNNNNVVWIDVNTGMTKIKEVEHSCKNILNVFVTYTTNGMKYIDKYDNKLIEINGYDIYMEKLDESLKNVIAATENNGSYYFLNDNGNLYRKNMKQMDLLIDGIDDNYCNMVCLYDTLWLIPFCNAPILCYELKNKKLKRIEYPKNMFRNSALIDGIVAINNGYIIDADKKIFFSVFGCDAILGIEKKENMCDLGYTVDFNEENVKSEIGIQKEFGKSGLKRFIDDLLSEK